jgi:hypothetical protein
MQLFSFKKWFFDIQTSDGKYFLLFISKITALGITKIYLQAHGAAKTGAGGYDKKLIFETTLDFIKEQENSIITRQGSIIYNPRQLTIALRCGEFSANLSYSTLNPSSLQFTPFSLRGKCRSTLSWKPLILKGNVSGELRTGPTQLFSFCDEKGYVDLVTSTILPFNLPVREMYWGRLQSTQADLTFTFLRSASKADHPSKIYFVHQGRLLEFDNVQLAISEQKKSASIHLVYPEKYTLTAVSGSVRLIIEIHSHEEAVANDFIGDTTCYGKTTIRILRSIIGSPKGIKSAAMANILIAEPEGIKRYENLPLIDEYVCFGCI